MSAADAGGAESIERLLQAALTPVEPPEELAERLRQTLTSLTELAAEELEAWELSAMRDPRNWMRPVAAAAIGTGAAAGLVVLRVRAAQRRRRIGDARDPMDLAQRTARALAGEARKLAGR